MIAVLLSSAKNNVATTLLIAATIALLIYIVWLRWRMSTSKARFALAAITFIFWCPLSLFAFISGPLPLQIFNAALAIGGVEFIRVSIDTPTWHQTLTAAIVSFSCMILIYRFSTTTIKTWHGPITVNVNELAKQNQDRNIALLAFVELKRIIKLESDLPASDTAINWQLKQVDAPKSPAWIDFARSLFEATYREASFPEPAWRDRISAWVGKIYLSDTINTANLVLFAFYNCPSRDELAARILQIKTDGFLQDGSHIYVVCEVEEIIQIYMKIDNFEVKILSKGFLLRSGLRLTDYARDLIRRFDEETLGGTHATLKETFVEAHIIKSGSIARVPLSAVIADWLTDRRRRHLAITGEYGQGKSTAMLHLCAKWARRFMENHNIQERVPLLIELRGQSPSELDPVAFLSAWAGRYGLSPKQLYNLVRDGKAIVIFEGFDELRNAGRAYDRHEHFNALWRMAFPGSKTIFTGRPNFFLDEAEKNRTLRADYSKGAGGNAFTELWELDRLTPSEIETAASGFGKDISYSIAAAAKSHAAFFDIISRPSMLPVIATIWDTIEAFQKTGRDFTNANLLERYLQAIYLRKEEEIEQDQRLNGAPDGSNYLLLPREVREAFTLAIVWSMAGSDARNTITRAEFDSVVSRSMDDFFKAFQQSGVPADITTRLRKFEERFRDEPRADKLERISSEVAAAGLFVLDPVGGPSNLRLPHKQFYEYLISKSAWYVLAYPNKEIAKILIKTDNRLSPFEKLLAERQALLFFSDIIDSDFSIFKTIPVRYYLVYQIYSLAINEVIGSRLQRAREFLAFHENSKGKILIFCFRLARATLGAIMNLFPRRGYYSDFLTQKNSARSIVTLMTVAAYFIFSAFLFVGAIYGRAFDQSADFSHKSSGTFTFMVSLIFFILTSFFTLNSSASPFTFSPPSFRALLILVAHRFSMSGGPANLTIYHLVLECLKAITSKNNTYNNKNVEGPSLRNEIKPII